MALPEPQFDLAIPYPGALIQSLRAFGYDLTTAVADLIDNSITAGARNVWLNFRWDGPRSSFTLTDDGTGMSEDRLVDAMRLGSQNPLVERGPRDLGRFGLGLKTSSFSQCQRLTVLSRTVNGDTALRCWDLSYVQQSDDWRLLKEGTEQALKGLNQLPDGSSGTAIVWENMDRLVALTDADNTADEKRFLEHVDRVKRHVSTVFHRFLERPDPLRIYLNTRSISPWDPFLRTESSTQWLAEETLHFQGAEIDVRPYVLPHHSRIVPETYALASGINGWNASQGFYVYRADRLLVGGDWLRLGFQKEDHHKLARILLDVPNSLDADWQIDVRKSVAYPPGPLREDLRRIARLTRSRAAEVYRYRGKVYTRRSGQASHSLVWEKKLNGRDGKIAYVINRFHPLIENLLKDGASADQVKLLLRVMEETVPVPLIIIDHAENPDQHEEPFDSSPSAELQEMLKQVYLALLAGGLSSIEARQRLGHTEPFDRFPGLIASLENTPQDKK